ncbi:MAG: hypothetical protein EON56_02190 [Alphaproteobacteria bacterium]|nr:MAG: hypothetical protein EON56_02190 [Alphaproteobacteria bacterium]
MEQLDLRQRVGEILQEEESPSVDWKKVEGLCLSLVEVLHLNQTACPDAVFHFVDDFDIRRRDPHYAQRQRDLVRRYVLNGEMVEHAPSVAASPWALVLVAVVITVLIWWVLR